MTENTLVEKKNSTSFNSGYKNKNNYNLKVLSRVGLIIGVLSLLLTRINHEFQFQFEKTPIGHAIFVFIPQFILKRQFLDINLYYLLFDSLFNLQYKLPIQGQVQVVGNLYGKGPLDAVFILGIMAIITILQRLFNFLCYYLTANTISNPSTRKKFSEQSFLFCYYVLSVSVGLWIYAHSSYYSMNLREMWSDYHQIHLDGLTKVYYLVTAAFWLQQLFSFLFFTPLHEQRKDHHQMTVHHCITTVLVLSSYIINFTKIGNMVLVIMDTSDVFLCLAKCLKYLNYGKICDIVFLLFTISWIYTRHYLYFKVIYSIIFDASAILGNIKYDPYLLRIMNTDDDWERPSSYFSVGNWGFFLFCFIALQALLIFWFAMILKVISKVVTGSGADDVREDED